MLERVNRRRSIGGVIQRRDVPEEEVERPQRQGDGGVGEDAEAVEDGDREDRLQQRAGQAEHQQQGRDVAEQQVLDHVDDHQLLGDVADRRDQRHRDRQQARGEAGLAPEGDGRPRAARVELRFAYSAAATISGATSERREDAGHVAIGSVTTSSA